MPIVYVSNRNRKNDRDQSKSLVERNIKSVDVHVHAHADEYWVGKERKMEMEWLNSQNERVREGSVRPL